MNATGPCPKDETCFPVEIKVSTSTLTISIASAHAHPCPTVIEVSAFPGMREPEIKARKVVNLLCSHLRNRYPQMRKMSPEFAETIDTARKSKTCTGALTVLTLTLDPAIFDMLCPFIIKLLRTRTFEPFYPRGVEYAAWFMGRCLLQKNCKNSLTCAHAIRKLILSPHLIEDAPTESSIKVQVF